MLGNRPDWQEYYDCESGEWWINGMGPFHYPRRADMQPRESPPPPLPKPPPPPPQHFPQEQPAEAQNGESQPPAQNSVGEEEARQWWEVEFEGDVDLGVPPDAQRSDGVLSLTERGMAFLQRQHSRPAAIRTTTSPWREQQRRTQRSERSTQDDPIEATMPSPLPANTFISGKNKRKRVNFVAKADVVEYEEHPKVRKGARNRESKEKPVFFCHRMGRVNSNVNTLLRSRIADHYSDSKISTLLLSGTLRIYDSKAWTSFFSESYGRKHDSK